MITPITFDTGIGPLDSGLEQSRDILLECSDFQELTTEIFEDLEILSLTLGWLGVGNYPMAYSGLKALSNTPAFGWACGTYVAWTGDDYILNEMDGPIKKWKGTMDSNPSVSSIYRNLGAGALAAAYHSRRDASSAQSFEKYISNEKKDLSRNNARIQETKYLTPTSTLPETPEQLATILGIGYQGVAIRGSDQVYWVCKKLNRMLTDSFNLKVKNPTDHLFLASLSITCFLYGLVGILPDVPSGRVTIGPNIPEESKSFKIQGLHLGPDTIDFSYMRKESEYIFVFEQKRGRVPLNLVFQPNLYGNEIHHIYVDVGLADLEWQADLQTSRVSTQVQLYLDKQRQVTIIST